MTNEQIEVKLGELVQVERKLTSEILNLIRLADERKMYLDRGYSSLFDWLTKYFGYSESAAQRRIQSARLVKIIPAISKKIEEGALNLTTVAKAQSAIRAQEKADGLKLSDQAKAEIIEKLEMKSSAESEKILIQLLPDSGMKAARETKTFFSEDLSRLSLNLPTEVMGDLERAKEILSHVYPDGITSADTLAYVLKDFLKRRDPLRKKSKPVSSFNLESGLRSGPASKVKTQPKRKANSVMGAKSELGAISSSGKRSKLQTSSRSEERSNLQASSSFEANLSLGSDARSNGKPNLKTSSYSTAAAAKQCVTHENRRDRRESSNTSSFRHRKTKQGPAIPAALRRAVLQRDQARCTFEDPRTKRICGSRHQIELDHIYPKSLGGEDSLENLRCLCSAHNQLAAQMILGNGRLSLPLRAREQSEV